MSLFVRVGAMNRVTPRTVGTVSTKGTRSLLPLSQKRLVLSNKATYSPIFCRSMTSTTEVKVPIELVKDLRQRTLAGYSDCKAALVAENVRVSSNLSFGMERRARFLLIFLISLSNSFF